MHDANGKPLKVGDEVVLRAKITSLCEGVETYCNVTVEAVHRMPTGLLHCQKCYAQIDPAKNTTGAHGHQDSMSGQVTACDGELKSGVAQTFSSINTKMLEKVD